MNDHQVFGIGDGQDGINKHAHQALGNAMFRLGGSSIFIDAAGRKNLQQAQLLDITADGSLCNHNTHIAQARRQILLRLDVVMLDNT